MSRKPVLLATLVLVAAAPPRASAADRGQFIVSVDVAELVRRTVGEGLVASVRSAGATGVSYRLLAGEKHAGSISVGVFAGKDEARAGLERRLGTMNLEPALRSDLEFGDVGTVYGRGHMEARPDRYVAFSRDNAVVWVGLRDGRVREVAKAIDQALITGTNGVQRSERIHLPRIVSVDVPDHLPPRKVVPVKVRVTVPERACRDRLSFANCRDSEVRWGGLPITDMRGEVEVTRVAQYRVPHTGPQAREHAVWVCYATAGCVVVSKKVAIPAIAEPAAAEEEQPPKELLKEYRGAAVIPDDLYKAYSDLVEAMIGKQDRIADFCLPHAITVTTGRRPQKGREYGPMNLPFLRDGFDRYIRNMRKDSEDTYLIRTGTSFLFFVNTKSMGWKLYRYGDKPIE